LARRKYEFLVVNVYAPDVDASAYR